MSAGIFTCSLHPGAGHAASLLPIPSRLVYLLPRFKHRVVALRTEFVGQNIRAFSSYCNVSRRKGTLQEKQR